MRQSVIALIICLLVLIVAVQNLFPVSIIIGDSRINISVAALVGMSFTIGFIIALLLLNIKRKTDKTIIKELKRKIVFLETPNTYSKQD